MRRIIDLTLPLRQGMRGVEIQQAMDLEVDGWNASRLNLYSHCGTHMDAPCHFRTGASGIEQVDLTLCMGKAKLLDLCPVEPRERITVDRLLSRGGNDITPGDRVLLRTDWSKHRDTPDYRDRLPRVALEAAQWLVERGIVLLGVEPPSVADVRDLVELRAVHTILLDAGIIIVEGLTNLDQIRRSTFQLVVLPLAIPGCDGSPVRAVAIEDAGDTA